MDLQGPQGFRPVRGRQGRAARRRRATIGGPRRRAVLGRGYRVDVAIVIEVTGFPGAHATLNAPPASYPVGVAEVVNRCITVGGWVVGSARQRTCRRSAIANLVLSSVRLAGPPTVISPLRVTHLFEHTETTEKAGISFRLGMGLAAVTASRVLGVPALAHVSVPGIPASGRRADLVGLDATGATHVVEAKARSHGVTAATCADAKAQAAATSAQLTALGTTVSTASVSAADLSTSPIQVLLEDPSVDTGGFNSDDEDRLAREFYTPVRDLLETKLPERSGFDSIDMSATGSWLPGAEVWLGLVDEIKERLTAEERLTAGENPLRTGGAFATSEDPWLVSVTSDGHVVVLGPRTLGDAEDVD